MLTLEVEHATIVFIAKHTNSNDSKMKKITITLPVLSKMKLLALILALLIVAIFLIGNRYLELSQQARYNKITAQWTTFEDSIFRFSLKYPKEWSFYDNEAETALSKPNDSEFILHMSPSDIAQNEVGLDQVIFVFAYHVDPKTDLFSWVKQNGYGKGLFPDSYYRVRKINGYEAVRFEFIQTKPLKDYLISKQFIYIFIL